MPAAVLANLKQSPPILPPFSPAITSYILPPFPGGSGGDTPRAFRLTLLTVQISRPVAGSEEEEEEEEKVLVVVVVTEVVVEEESRRTTSILMLPPFPT
jgi:hypothetical protein